MWDGRVGTAIVSLAFALIQCTTTSTTSSTSGSALPPVPPAISNEVQLAPGTSAAQGSFTEFGNVASGTVTLPPAVAGSGEVAFEALGPSAEAAPLPLTSVNGESVTPELYVQETATVNDQFAATPALSFTGPEFATGGPFYLVAYDHVDKVWYVMAGPGTISGDTVSFPELNEPVALQSGQQYTLAVVSPSQPLSPTPWIP